MADALERITTEYVDSEDRLRISGASSAVSSVVIWITQRLLHRLVPVLLNWLERGAATPHAELMQEWAQQAARAGLEAQAPVMAEASSCNWLAHSIDITLSDEAVILTFKSEDDQQAALTLAATPLRQWLNIVHDAHIMAGWSMAVWPAWISDSNIRTPGLATKLH